MSVQETASEPLALLADGGVASETAEQPLPMGPALMLVIQAAVFMVSAEARVIAPLLPAIANEFSTTIAATGLLISAYALPYGIFQLVYGPLADRFSRQRIMGLAMSLFGLGTLVSGFAPTIGGLNMLRFATGAAAAGVIPVALAYVGDAVPYGQRQAALGRIVSVAAFGGVISAALGGLVAGLLSWRALFIGYGLLAMVVAVMLLRLPVRRARPAGRTARGWFTPYQVIVSEGGQRALALYILVGFEGFVATSTLGYLGALLHERDGFAYGLIGALLTLNGVGNMIAARFVGRLVARLGEVGMVRTGGLLIAAAYLLLAMQPTLLFFPLGMLLGGAGFAIAHSTLQTRATELVPSQRGTAIAVFAFALFLGGGVGTYVAGQAIERAGFSATLLGTALAMLGFVAIAGPLLRRRV